MPDIFFATVLVVWTLSGHAGVVERSGPLADRIACEQAAMDMAVKHQEFYGQLPVIVEPRCEKWEPDLFRQKI